MTEEYIDELDDSLDDIESVTDGGRELYEHFRVVVDKGQSPVRIDKYLFERLVNSSRNRIQQAAEQASGQRLCPRGHPAHNTNPQWPAPAVFQPKPG